MQLSDAEREELRSRMVKALFFRWVERMGASNAKMESAERLVDEVLEVIGDVGYVVVPEGKEKKCSQ